MKKKMLAFLLAAAMGITLCSCGERPEEEISAAEMAETETVAPLDFAGAYGRHDPEDIVFTVDGENVTWQEFFYEVAYTSSIIAAQQGASFTDWDAICPLYVDADGNAVYTYGEVVLQSVVNTLIQYHIMDKHMTELGITLNEDSQSALENLREQTVSEDFDGDEEAFLSYLDSLFCSEEIWTWFNTVDSKYSQAFSDLYGEMGSDYPDEDVMAYAAGDPDGAWMEYVQLKMICLYTDDAAEAGDEANADADLADSILDELTGAEDRDAKYAELYALYNEESGLDPYSGGWCLYQGDTADEIYDAARSMATGDIGRVSIDGAEVIVWKVPVDPDAGVTWDSSTGTVYTLRYYAAWQDYTDRINQWIEEGTETARWTEDFENFSLREAFA